MRFADVIAPMSVEEFCEEYVDRRWIVQSGPPDRYSRLLSWTQLNAALRSLRLPPNGTRLRLVRNGSVIPADQYMEHHARYGSILRAGAFERHLSDGATLVLDAVNELFEQVRELTDDTESVLGGYAQVNLYAGWRKHKGFDLHWDDHDTIVLQVYGRKAWTVYPQTCEYPSKEFAGSWGRPQGPPVWDGILEAGSILYMPRGWWHVAVPMDEPTLHLTVGVGGLVGQDLLKWLATQLCDQRIFRMNIPYRADSATQQAYLSEMRSLIARALSDDCLARVKSRKDAELPRPGLPELPHAIVRTASIAGESVLLLAGVRRLATTVLPTGQLAIAANGSRWICSAALRGAVTRLNGMVGRRFDELCADLERPLVMELKSLLTVMHLTGALLVRSADSG